MAINRYGGGAKTNANGLRFEQETSLQDALENEGYAILDDGTILDRYDNELGLLAPKHNLYKRILKPNNIQWELYISKKLLPDEALYNYTNNTIYIVEKKFQNSSGSVDEKLQSCVFKKQQYQKLFRDLKCNVEYVFVCNNFFANKKYKDVHDFIFDNGCYIFFNEIPLDFFQLPYSH